MGVEKVESVFVTGANRGIGLEFVRQFVNLTRPPRYVFATYRNEDKNKALEDIAAASKVCSVMLIRMDVTKDEDIKAARKVVEATVGDRGLTLLINNAGLAAPMPFPNVTRENLLLHFNANSAGPLIVLQELLPSLQKAAKSLGGEGLSVSRAAVFNISSMAGSITDIVNHPREWLAVVGYRTSKAALNMVMRVASGTIKDDGILLATVCPGWVKTDMGTDKAQIDVTESVSTMLDTLSRLDDSHHGLFMDRFGNTKEF